MACCRWTRGHAEAHGAGRQKCVRLLTVPHLPLIFLYCTAFYGLGLNSERQIAMYAFLALCFMAGMLSDRLIDRPIAKRVMRRLSGAR